MGSFYSAFFRLSSRPCKTRCIYKPWKRRYNTLMETDLYRSYFMNRIRITRHDFPAVSAAVQ